MARLSIALLGPPVVRHGEAALVLPTRKALALLAYLAVEGGSQPRDKLAALLWPDRDDRHARSMLRYSLTQLRNVLGADVGHAHLVADRDRLGLGPGALLVLDVHDLAAAHAALRTPHSPDHVPDARTRLVARLEAAAGLWRGEPLDGFSLPDAPDFDHWTTALRAACRRQVEGVLDRLSQLQADGGNHADALATAERWAAISPLDEEAHRRLMRLHLAAGDRPAALRAYEACREHLAAQLGAEPSPETEAMTLLLGGTHAPPPSTGLGAASGANAAMDEAPLVGRTAELVRLVDLYHAAVGGCARVAVLRGEPGIGKTRLAHELLGWAAGRGADVLRTRAFETGGRLPFQPIVDALRPRLEGENAPDDLLGDVWLAELARLLPELRERYPDLTVPAGDEAAARTRLFETVARLGQALAGRRPVVLFVDDVQWADVGSLDLLHYAARRWTQSSAPLLLLLSLRGAGLTENAALEEWLADMRRDPGVLEIELGPLGRDDLVQLVDGLGQSARPEAEAFGGWLYAETSGQPLFAVEILRELVQTGALAATSDAAGRRRFDLPADPSALGRVLPPGIREVVRARLARVSPVANELLAAAAVLAQEFTFAQLCRVAGVDEDAALPALDQVVRVQLLREATDRATGDYAFRHDRIRDAVYAEAGPARQRVFHRRAAEALAEAAPASRLAHHALAAALDEPALRFSTAAGDEALRLLAAGDALVHYDRALAIAERVGRTDVAADLHARRGTAYRTITLWPDARRELEAALDALTVDRGERRAELLVELLEVCWWLLDIAGLRGYATEAIQLAARLGRLDLETLATCWLAAPIGADGDLDECRAMFDRAAARGRALGAPPPAPVYTYRSLPPYWLGRLDEAVEHGREGVRLAGEAHHTTALMFSLPNLGLALAASGRYAEAFDVFDEARRFGREHGAGTLLARAIAMSAGLHLDLLDFDGNEARAEEARDLARSLSFAPPAVSAGLDLLLNFARRGDVGRAEQILEEVAAAADRASGWHGWLWHIRLAEARAEIGLARGDREAAIVWATQAVERSRERGRVKYQALGHHTRGRALLALGRTEEAVVDLRAAVDLAGPVGDPALFVRVTADLLEIDGDDTLARAAATIVTDILGAVPEPRMRDLLIASAPVRSIQSKWPTALSAT